MKILGWVFSLHILVSCTSQWSKIDPSDFEYSPEIEGRGLVLEYDKWSVTQKELFQEHPEFRALHEEFLSLQTATALKALSNELGDETITITGSPKEAVIGALQRLGIEAPLDRVQFKNNPGVAKISGGTQQFQLMALSLNNLELSRLQTQYFLKGHKAAEDLLVLKILTPEQKSTLREGIEVSNEEVKTYLRRRRIDPHRIGLSGMRKIKDQLLKEKEMQVFKDYVRNYIYKKTVKSWWKKPSFQMDPRVKSPFRSGSGSLAIVTFAPYDCKSCVDWNMDIQEFLAKPRIHLRYHPLVLPSGSPSGQLFFDSGLCLQEQGKENFWKFLGEINHVFSKARLVEKTQAFLEKEKLNPYIYKSCVEEKAKQKLWRVPSVLSSLGSASFPLVLVGPFVFSGEVDPQQVQEALRF